MLQGVRDGFLSNAIEMSCGVDIQQFRMSIAKKIARRPGHRTGSRGELAQGAGQAIAMDGDGGKSSGHAARLTNGFAQLFADFFERFDELGRLSVDLVFESGDKKFQRRQLLAEAIMKVASNAA